MLLLSQVKYFSVLYEILLLLYCVLNEILHLSTLKTDYRVMKYSCGWLRYCIISNSDVNFVTHIATHKYLTIMLYRFF
jgi:hypothetical protein